MKNKTHFLIVLIMTLFAYQNIDAQINIDWEINYGTPDTIDNAKTIIDHQGNLITTGNTMISGEDANVLITKYNKKGLILWQQNYNYAGTSKDFGTCLTSDNSGNIYVAGACFTSYYQGTDYLILKYDTDGNLIWSQTFNSGSYTIDIPIDIALDSNNDIFVTGSTENIYTKEDYLTIKLNNNGTILWNTSYDYISAIDKPIGLIVDTDNNVIVTGNSNSNCCSSCDITTIKYDGNTGNELASNRDAQICIGFDKPASIKQDAYNNIYITGFVATDDQGANIKTIKYNTNLEIVWAETYDGVNADDKATAMEVDNQGNVIVTGYSINSNNTKNVVTIKYDNNGTELWVKTRQTVDQLGNCQAHKMKLDNNGNIYLFCEKHENNTNKILALKYDTQGNRVWEKAINKEENEIINDIDVSNDGEVYLTTKKDNNLKTSKISYYDKPMVAVLDSVGNPLFVQGEILIRFDPSVVKHDAVDKVDLQYGNAHAFLKDTIIDIMSNALGYPVDNNIFIKVFTRMTTADSISISRLGEEVRISTFWATFKMEVKAGNELGHASVLDSLFPFIKYSHINGIGTLDNIPNDNLITTQQEGLVPTTQYPNAHINIEDAWDIETGLSSVKVGVFDFPIYWAHEEFGDGSYVGSKIEGGWDYYSQLGISNVSEVTNSHGTSCAGIIGALRNNGKGIAGIAGGDGNYNRGASLYSFGIINSNNWTIIDIVANAIIEGSVNSTAGYGYGLDIQSHSWGIGLGDNFQDHVITSNDMRLLNEATDETYKNQCIFVASRGNDNNENIKYPSCVRDEKVINVGASGTNGLRANYSTGNTTDDWGSSYGGNVDVIAPGVSNIVASPIAPVTNQNCDINLSGYNCFNGTSAAAPHVAGVVSLMCSQHNTIKGYPNNLSPEDVENILQKNTFSSGYNDDIGWGRVNAGEAVKKVSNHYKVRHFQQTVNNSTAVLIEEGRVMHFPEGIENLAQGGYLGEADVYELTTTINHNIPASENVVDAWIRNSSCKDTYHNTNVILNPHIIDASLVSFNNNSATFKSYFYYVKEFNYIGQWIGNRWFPEEYNVKFAYSLHTFDQDWSDIEKVEELSMFKIYPNPANSHVKIEYKLTQSQTSKVEIFNQLGQLTFQQNINNSKVGYINIDISKFDKGLYFVKFISNNKIKTEKLIIN